MADFPFPLLKPFYRSRLFWFGLLGVAFLFWAWGRSNVTHRSIYLDPSLLASTRGRLIWWQPESHYVLRVDDRSGAGATLQPRPSPLAGRISPGSRVVTVTAARFSTDIRPLHPDEACWFPPLQWELDQTAGSLVVIPYWLMTASYTAIFFVGVAWWQRRKKRLLRASAAPPP